ncbi:NUDIX domain-containing protein [Streptomyces sp. AC602_WCS936]|uniref:NUDIX domain-containing protein n=1 Tax=Streptomyces sp. AC602_WCS936 TaxID=2823685 RepID=UPI001C277814|nr:NUDIX hydrolase [Streptomyces sp. AC602_WCS936]
MYEHVSVSDGVRVVALDTAGRTLLVEDTFYLQGRRMLHVPGGGTDGQEPRRAALRELEEETGLAAGRLDTLGVIDPLPGTTRARAHLMLATDLRPGRMRRDATEEGMTVQWRPLHDAVEAVRAGEITEAGSVTALLLTALTPGRHQL